MAAIIGAWWWWGSGNVGARVVGTPEAVVADLARWPSSSQRLDDVSATMTAAAIGFAYGVSAALVVAFLARFVVPIQQFIAPFISSMNAMPKVALGSAYIVAFGLGIASKVAFVVSIVFFIVYYPIYEGLRNVPADVLNHARVIGARRIDLFKSVYVPASLIWVLTGLRLALTYSILGAAAGEYLGATAGVGHYIREAMFYGDGVAIMSGVLFLSLVALAFDRVLIVIERRYSAWRLF